MAELEAANNRLTDMLWGRRSERRSESPDQQRLPFGDEPGPPPSAEEQEIITAQAQADEERDRELLDVWRRGARRAGSNSRAAKNFPQPSNVASGCLTFPKSRSKA